MVGLIDIAPSVETVDVQGTSVAVHGVSAKGVAHLLGRFPELRKLMTGQEVEAEQLMAMGGDAVAAIIAAGCGYPGDETGRDGGGQALARRAGRPPGRDPAADAAEGHRPFRREADGARGHPRGRRRSIRYGAGFEIAEAVDALIGANYPPAEVWAMTPRQIAGSLYFARRRRQREAAEQLALGALAARGEPREVKRQLDQLQRE